MSRRGRSLSLLHVGRATLAGSVVRPDDLKAPAVQRPALLQPGEVAGIAHPHSVPEPLCQLCYPAPVLGAPTLTDEPRGIQEISERRTPDREGRLQAFPEAMEGLDSLPQLRRVFD